MTALANLSALVAKWRAEAQALREHPSYYAEIRARGIIEEKEAHADELNAAIATLSPAELGGVEAVAIADCDGRFVEIKALTPAYGLPVGKHNLYTTPRADEAWQPIESAPYGESVWVFDAASDPQQYTATLTEGAEGPYWRPDESLVADVLCEYLHPTHWRPLPSPPSPGAAK